MSAAQRETLEIKHPNTIQSKVIVFDICMLRNDGRLILSFPHK